MSDNLNLIGRKKESEILKNLLDKGKGRFLLVAGEAGIGKTRFIETILNESGICFYTSRPIDDAAPPFSPISSIFRFYLRKQKADKIDFGPLTNYLSALLPEIGEPAKELDKETLCQAVADGFMKMSDEKPLALLIEDLHWADEATLEILPSLSEKLSFSKILLIGSSRTDGPAEEKKIASMRNELRRRKRLVELNLRRFSIKETAELVKSIINIEPSSSLSGMIYEKTQGVPLFIEELCLLMIERKLLSLKNNEAFLEAAAAMPLPESISDTVFKKVQNLSENARFLLDIAAAAGEEFDLNLFEAAGGEDNSSDELFLNNLITIKENNIAGFKHALVREALKNKISWSRKKEINRKIAEYFSSRGFPPEMTAIHWLEAGETEKARKSFLEALKKSCRVQAYSDAAKSAVKALELWPADKEQDEKMLTMLQLAQCLHLNGKPEEALKILKEISERDEINNRYYAEVMRLSAVAYALINKWELAAEARLASAEYFERDNNVNDAAIEYLAAAARFTSLMDLPKALNCSRKASELSELASNIDIKSRALGLLGNIIAMSGRPIEGKEIVQQGLDLALMNNLTEAASEIYRRLAATMEYQSDYLSAKNAYKSAYNFCITSGSEFYAQICLGCMSTIFFQTGEWKRSMEVCIDVLKNKKSTEGSRSAALTVAGLIHGFRGQIKSAEKYLNEAYQIAAKIRNNIIFFGVLWGKGILAEISEENETVHMRYSEVLELWKNYQEKHESIPVLMWAAEAFMRGMKEKELITCIENLTLISNETSNPEALSALAFAMGEYSALNSRNDDAVQKFRQALLQQEKVLVPYEKMLIEFRLGEMQMLTNETEQGSAHLNNAFTIARNLGMRPYLSRIGKIISQSGMKFNERTTRIHSGHTEDFHLTKRQNEILKLLCSGSTNKEIAEKMFLSRRTVDMHVSHILERLNCRTRTEAISRAREMEII